MSCVMFWTRRAPLSFERVELLADVMVMTSVLWAETDCYQINSGINPKLIVKKNHISFITNQLNITDFNIFIAYMYVEGNKIQQVN